MTELTKNNKIVYKDDTLIVVQPYEMMVEKVKNNKNRLLIDEISELSGEFIEVNDPTLYLFIFIENKNYYGDIYKGYFINTSLLLSPIFVCKFREHIETNMIKQYKKITEWFGSFILQQHNYSSDVLNRMDFYVLAYHAGGLQQSCFTMNTETLYSNRVSESALFQRQITRFLLLLNSVVPKENKLQEYIFPIKFITVNNRITSTCEILNQVVSRVFVILSKEVFKYKNSPCF